MYGGKSERHFRVVQLDGKKVELGGVSITSKASPGSAARKLLTSIAHEKGLKKNKKASMPKVKFCIQEYTQGSSKKVYGPYVGHFHKYTAAELKKAATAKGKVKFTMKPVVKLAKKKNNMKGGYGSNVEGPGLNDSINNLIKALKENQSFNGYNMKFHKKILNILQHLIKQISGKYGDGDVNQNDVNTFCEKIDSLANKYLEKKKAHNLGINFQRRMAYDLGNYGIIFDKEHKSTFTEGEHTNYKIFMLSDDIINKGQINSSSKTYKITYDYFLKKLIIELDKRIISGMGQNSFRITKNIRIMPSNNFINKTQKLNNTFKIGDSIFRTFNQTTYGYEYTRVNNQQGGGKRRLKSRK